MKKNAILNETGSAVAYLFLAIFLAGLIIATMMKDSGVATVNAQLRETKAQLTADIEMIESAINECILTHSDPVDVNADGDINADDNPHVPYPLYDDLSFGEPGENVRLIRCPGTGQLVLGLESGRFFKLLGDTRYSVTYKNTVADGIQLIIENSVYTSIWLEALNQMAATAPTCKMEVDSTNGSCATGACLTYWIKRVTCP